MRVCLHRTRPVAPKVFGCRVHGTCDEEKCASCPDEAPLATKERRVERPCKHLGGDTGALIECQTCTGRVQLKLFTCVLYGDCTIGKAVPGKACCNGAIVDGGLVPCEGRE